MSPQRMRAHVRSLLGTSKGPLPVSSKFASVMHGWTPLTHACMQQSNSIAIYSVSVLSFTQSEAVSRLCQAG